MCVCVRERERDSLRTVQNLAGANQVIILPMLHTNIVNSPKCRFYVLLLMLCVCGCGCVCVCMWVGVLFCFRTCLDFRSDDLW